MSMRRKFLISAVLGFGLLGTGAVQAQDAPPPPPAGQGAGDSGAQVQIHKAEPQVTIIQDQPNVQIEQLGEPSIQVTTVPTVAGLPPEMMLNWTVKSTEGEELGEVRDLLMAPDGSRLDSAIVTRSTFLGLGEELVQVPWQDVRVNRDAEELALSMPQDRFKDLPEFKYPQNVNAVVGPQKQ
jgi:hypothetical protein